MPKFDVTIAFKGDKKFTVEALTEEMAQDLAVDMLEWDIPETNFLEITKIERQA